MLESTGTKLAKAKADEDVDTSDGKTTLIQPPIGIGLVALTKKK